MFTEQSVVQWFFFKDSYDLKKKKIRLAKENEYFLGKKNIDERDKNQKKVNMLSQDLESEMKKALTCLQMLQGN